MQLQFPKLQKLLGYCLSNTPLKKIILPPKNDQISTSSTLNNAENAEEAPISNTYDTDTSDKHSTAKNQPSVSELREPLGIWNSGCL